MTDLQRSGDAMPTPSSTRILRLKAVLERTGLSRSTLSRRYLAAAWNDSAATAAPERLAAAQPACPWPLPTIRRSHVMSNASPILRLSKVLERTGLSRSTLYRKLHCGTFPRQLRISARCTGWRESDVDGWLRDPENYSVAPVYRKQAD
jgi:prophage regulatory protein